jgi:hypothetical protein
MPMALAFGDELAEERRSCLCGVSYAAEAGEKKVRRVREGHGFLSNILYELRMNRSHQFKIDG